MIELDGQKNVEILLIIALVLGVISLTLPWWMLLVSINSEMVASFNLFLWGIVETGFHQTFLPFEWFSYTTLLLVAAGILLGLGGYWFRPKNGRKARLLIICEAVCTIGGCLFYLGSLLFTFADPIYPQWMIAPSGIHGGLFISILSVFSIRQHFNTTVFEFLSMGSFLAIISSILTLTAVYILTKKKLHDNSTTSPS